MTSVHLEYRNYVPPMYFAVKFFHYKVLGEGKEEIDDDIQSLIDPIYKKHWGKLHVFRETVEGLNEKLRVVDEQIASIKNTYNFLQRNILNPEVIDRYQSLKKERDQLQKERWMLVEPDVDSGSCYLEQRLEVESYLERKGFTLKEYNANGNECVTYSVIYIK